MKKIVALFLCAACALSLAACGGRPAEDERTETEGSAETIGMKNPFADYDTMEDAAAAVGFDFIVPDTVDGYAADRLIQIMDGRMFQVIFRNEDGSRVILRKAAGTEDLSGDYREYSETKTIPLSNGAAAEARGENGEYGVAVWTAGDYAYAVTLDQPTDEGTLATILNGVDPAE